MSDTTTVWREFNGDWSAIGSTLETGSDLQTAVLISLFTDRQANQDDVIPDGTSDPRGWWADGDSKIGSRLWLLTRSKQTTETLNRANGYIAEALQWLIDDGVIAAFDIACQWLAPSRLGANVIAYKSDGTKTAMNFGWVWSS